MKNKKKNLSIPMILEKLHDFSRQDPKDVFAALQTRPEGLSAGEAALRLETCGPNKIAQEKVTPWYVQLIRVFFNPFIAVLLFLAGISLVMDVILAAPRDRSWRTVVVITVMVTVSGMLRFFQEYRSNQEAEQLKALVRTTATVLRSGTGIREVDMEELAPGDVIQLAAGDMIPADVRLLAAKDLFVSQAALTGESEPVEKYDRMQRNGNQNHEASLDELENICFMGTNVVSGSARGVVVATGNETYFGSMAKSLAGHRSQTGFEKGVNRVSWLLIRFMLGMVPTVFVVNGVTKGNWLEAFLFAISVAVGLTPEMLPMIVTTNLAKGAVLMAKRKTVVKRLNAIQNFGAMDILCTDKTGTLTLDKVVLERHLDIHGNADDRILRHAYLNSYFQTGFRNLLDRAVLEFGAQQGFTALEKLYVKVDEIPFDFTRRRLSVVLTNGDGKRQLITKGAVEEMLAICSYAESNGQVVPLADDIRAAAKELVQQLNNDGMRVLAVAQKNEIPQAGVFSVADESRMVLMGYIGFLDPPKETAAQAIKVLREHGIQIKILTGDNDVVSRKICREVGLSVNEFLLGREIERMTAPELEIAAEKTTLFAKLTPLQKLKIVKALQQAGHTVGFLGDGINDAAALREADVGVSVDTAMDIAKESADVILLEKNLMVLEEGVVLGRNTFGNIVKYIKTTASSNFGNMLSVLAASAFLPFLPMLPIHLLVQNLCYDLSQVSIPWDRMDQDYLKAPRKWDITGIRKFMLCIGPISSVFDLITYGVMWNVFKANAPTVQSLFQSGWFVEGLLSQTLIVHMVRTQKIPFIRSRAAAPVLLLTGTMMAIGMGIPFTSFGASIGLQPLPLTYFPWLFGILLSYCVLTQLVKVLYIKQFKNWL